MQAEVKIHNWDKYNPRSDRKNFTWFRFQNTFFNDSDVWRLSSEEKLLFIYLLCDASKNNNSMVRVAVDYYAHQLKTTTNEIIKSLQSLENQKLLTMSSRPLNVGEETSLGRPTYERTNDTLRYDTNGANEKLATPNGSPPVKNLSSLKENKVHAFIKAYCDAFKVKYRTNPQIRQKDAGIAKRLAVDMSQERAHDLIAAYFSMNDPWFITKRHDLVTLEQNLNAIVIKADTGATVTKSEITQIERTESMQNQIERLNRMTGGEK